jgi:hypothetical protein
MSWRDTLFIWKGKAKSASGVLEWEGSWAGVDSALAKNVLLPSDAVFQKSSMLFSVSGNQSISAQERTESSEKDATTLSFQITKGKGWLLDDLLHHQDQVHDLLFYKSSKIPTVLVGAVGINDFGRFLAFGRCEGVANLEEINSGKEFTLILGRRYLEDKDQRSSWKALAEMKECLENIARFDLDSVTSPHGIFQINQLDAATIVQALGDTKKRKHAVSTTATGNAVSKKVKMEQASHAIELCWYSFTAGESVQHTVNIKDIKSVQLSGAVEGSTPCENHDRTLGLRLVKDGKVLARIDLFWWEDAKKATLMHFHQLCQDLADFSGELWVAAGRRSSDYCDMSIEFGESRHSCVKVNSLIKKALKCKLAKEILYVHTVSSHSDKKAVSELYRVLPALFNRAHIIAHNTDSPPTSWRRLRSGWRISSCRA